MLAMGPLPAIYAKIESIYVLTPPLSPATPQSKMDVGYPLPAVPFPSLYPPEKAAVWHLLTMIRGESNAELIAAIQTWPVFAGAEARNRVFVALCGADGSLCAAQLVKDAFQLTADGRRDRRALGEAFWAHVSRDSEKCHP
jgi:hypothetical protein